MAYTVKVPIETPIPDGYIHLPHHDGYTLARADAITLVEAHPLGTTVDEGMGAKVHLDGGKTVITTRTIEGVEALMAYARRRKDGWDRFRHMALAEIEAKNQRR